MGRKDSGADLVPMSDLEERLGVSRSTLQRLAREAGLTPQRFPGDRRGHLDAGALRDFMRRPRAIARRNRTDR